MKGIRGIYAKSDGREEVRWHFPTWVMEDGSLLQNVSIFPHLCGTCAGGDHTHIEVDDSRRPFKILEEKEMMFDPDVKKTIDAYLASKKSVDKLTEALHISLHTRVCV